MHYFISPIQSPSSTPVVSSRVPYDSERARSISCLGSTFSILAIIICICQKLFFNSLHPILLIYEMLQFRNYSTCKNHNRDHGDRKLADNKPKATLAVTNKLLQILCTNRFGLIFVLKDFL